MMRAIKKTDMPLLAPALSPRKADVVRKAVRFEKILKSNTGFTFIEMIVALALMATLTAVFGMGLVAATQSFNFSRANTEVVQKGQMAMVRLTRELSEMRHVVNINSGSDPYIIYERIEDSGGVPVLSRVGLHYHNADQRLRLYDNPPDPLDGGTLAQGRVLVDGVQDFSLQFYNGSTQMTALDDVRSSAAVQITLTLTRSDNPDPSVAHRFVTLVHMRNTDNAGGAVQ